MSTAVLTPEDIAALILDDVTDLDHATTWVAVVLAESGGNPVAYNLVDEDPTSQAYLSTDNGLFQINSYWHGGRIPVHEANRPDLAWRYAYQLAGGDRHPPDWTPWVAYKSGAYRAHLATARDAVLAVAAVLDDEVDDAVTLYPIGYGRSLVTLTELRAKHGPKMHPEFERRLFAWIEAQGGAIGIGGGWRDNGTQPDKPGFAPEGRSFHQYQEFASGIVAYCAVDLVVRNGDKIHRAPTWAEVPAQGSEWAKEWGLHCNVSSEAWHMQPIEIDGWGSWASNGQVDPVAGYKLPTDEVPPPPPPPPLDDEDDMKVIRVGGSAGIQYLQQGMFARHIPDGATKQAWAAALGFDPKAIDVDEEYLSNLTFVGTAPGFA